MTLSNKTKKQIKLVNTCKEHRHTLIKNVHMFLFRLKKSILHRGSVVANRWKKTALLARLKNAAQVAAASGQEDKTDGRPPSKVTMVDIARLAMADRNSNVPSEDDDDSAKL